MTKLMDQGNKSSSRISSDNERKLDYGLTKNFQGKFQVGTFSNIN